MEATTFQTIQPDDETELNFVALVSSGDGDKIAVMSGGGHNFYYTIDGLRNLQSRLKLEGRLALNSMIDLLNATNVEDMFIDLDVVPDLVTREVDPWGR